MAGVETGEPQPKVSALVNYQLDGFLVEKQVAFIVALGRDLEIIVRPAGSTSIGIAPLTCTPEM